MSLPSISPEHIPTLRHLTNLLHLFHHRNKNQHRHSTWYRHLSLFRKHLAHLTTSLETLHSPPETTHLARTRKKAQDTKLIADIDARLKFWRDVLVGKWHRAFSQVVADGRFSVLGLVLMAVLGEVCTVVGVTGELEEMGQREVERVLEEFGREEWGGGGSGGGEREDVGMVVRRGGEEADDPERTEGNDDVGERAVSTSTVKAPAPIAKKRKSENLQKATKKKRKKKGDAIDDIFG